MDEGGGIGPLLDGHVTAHSNKSDSELSESSDGYIDGSCTLRGRGS